MNEKNLEKGRYQIAVNGYHYYIIDTATGETWHGERGNPPKYQGPLLPSIDEIIKIPKDFKPNFVIEKERGYEYNGESGALIRVPAGLSKSELELNIKCAVKRIYMEYVKYERHNINLFVYKMGKGKPAPIHYAGMCKFALYGDCTIFGDYPYYQLKMEIDKNYFRK
jgi:hypothetical protein